MMFTILGIAMCLAVLLQLGLFASGSLAQLAFNRKQFAASQNWLKNQIDGMPVHAANATQPVEHGSWRGFREFYVAQIIQETVECKSVILKPVDGKPIADFKPGQHLTFRLPIPGESKPLVRCYSLSDGPGKGHYRISVKAISSPQGKSELPAGKASSFINNNLIAGDRLEVKAPSGHFYLDASESPIVLLAGGIGITPMISMIDSIIQQEISRTVLLVYGVRNSEDQAFKQYIDTVTRQHQNIHVIHCFSQPSPTDKAGVDYHVKGYASVDMLKQVLPNNEYVFYLCGPPQFMDSLYEGLIEWQVPESRISFEAFGPATIKKKASRAPDANQELSRSGGVEIKFAASGNVANWTAENDSLLDCAEENDVIIDSGCRAGSCGTCATGLISGKVKYADGVEPDCEPGKCLVCVARPDGPVELDA